MRSDRIDNPYEPPSASIGAETFPGLKLGWKLYFWLSLVLYPLSLLMLGVQWMQPLDVLDLLVTGTGLTGLLGYVYSRRIAGRRFWRRWLPFQLSWDIAIVMLWAPLGLSQNLPVAPGSAVERTTSLLFLIPLYIGLFRYAFRSPDLWRVRPAV
jgi:hypothetical protein